MGCVGVKIKGEGSISNPNGKAFATVDSAYSLTVFTNSEQPDIVNTISLTHDDLLATLTTLTTLVMHMIAACVDIALKW